MVLSLFNGLGVLASFLARMRVLRELLLYLLLPPVA